MSSLQSVDHSALRTNQGVIILLLVAAFIFNTPLLVGLVAVVMLAGTLFKRPGFLFFYTHILRRLGWVRPDVLPDYPEPHRFAQGFGGTVVLAGFLALLGGLSGLGWGLAWLVVALAALNLFAGFCAGCMVYYWMNRLGVPGFQRSSPGGRFPGLSPRRSSHG